MSYLTNSYRYAVAEPVITDTNLKAYWQFNETSGDSLNASQGTADLGSAADLQITGATYNQTGSPSGLGNSMLFDGTDDFAKAGTSLSQFNFMHNTSGKYTMTWWMKIVGTNNNTDRIAGTCTATSEIGFVCQVRTNNALRSSVYRGVDNTWAIAATTSTSWLPTDNAWHFYCIRWDYSLGSNNMSIKFDNTNEELFTKTANAAVDTNATSELYIAASIDSTLFINAYFLEMAIFNDIMSAEDETTLWNSGNGQPIY